MGCRLSERNRLKGLLCTKLQMVMSAMQARRSESYMENNKKVFFNYMDEKDVLEYRLFKPKPEWKKVCSGQREYFNSPRDRKEVGC